MSEVGESNPSSQLGKLLLSRLTNLAPTNYIKLVGDQGIGPCTSRSQSEHSTVELVPDLVLVPRAGLGPA